MTSHAAIGWSTGSNGFSAGQAAARATAKRLAGRRPRIALVFGSSWFDQPQLLEGIRSILGPALIVGGSTAGEITPEGPQSHSCVILALAEDTPITVGVSMGTDLARDPRSAGYQAAQQAVRQLGSPQRQAFLFFGDGLFFRYTRVMQGIQEVLGTHFMVVGALAGDDLRLVRTFQYADQARHDAIAGLLLGGCQVGVGLEHGFRPISKPRKITRAEANVIYELDGRPASSVYEEYLGPSGVELIRGAGLARLTVAYPLGVQADGADQFLLRNVLSFGANGSLVCTGEMLKGSWVRLMMGSKELALDAAEAAAQTAMRQLSAVEFVLLFSSAVRRRLLGRDARLELARVRQVVGSAVPIAGCYTYGEQAPPAADVPYGHPLMQTSSCLVLAVGA